MQLSCAATARRLVKSALAGGGLLVEVGQVVESSAGGASSRGRCDDRTSPVTDDVDEDDAGCAYKPLAIALDAFRVQLRSREGSVKSEQLYSGNTWWGCTS
jgi:hypothetical protein